MQIQINQNRKELKHHGTFEFPVMVCKEQLSSYERHAFFWHWHPEIELTLILEGDIVYQIENQTYHLKAGEGLFCNANMLHTGHQLTANDCTYMAITFDPKLIYGFETSAIQTKYVTPLTMNSQFQSLALSREVPWQSTILDELEHLTEQYYEATETYELEVLTALLHIWTLLYKHAGSDTRHAPTVMRERERLLDMLDFIHAHYQEKFTLEDMAAQINLCKSECCRFFKKRMGESIFDYLLEYRIKASLPLLRQTNKSITDIAAETGFSNPCYFTKIFKEQLGCTPREYKKGVDH